MSEEQHNEETEVEAHGIGKVDNPRFAANDEPRDEAETDDDVEGHLKVSRPKHS
jgi:hypothetical protein